MGLQGVEQNGFAQRFGQCRIHASGHDLVNLISQGMGGQGNDRNVLPAFQLPYPARRLAPVHFGHGYIHENQIRWRVHDAFHRFAPVFRIGKVQRQVTHHLAKHKAVRGVIFRI